MTICYFYAILLEKVYYANLNIYVKLNVGYNKDWNYVFMFKIEQTDFFHAIQGFRLWMMHGITICIKFSLVFLLEPIFHMVTQEVQFQSSYMKDVELRFKFKDTATTRFVAFFFLFWIEIDNCNHLSHKMMVTSKSQHFFLFQNTTFLIFEL